MTELRTDDSARTFWNQKASSLVANSSLFSSAPASILVEKLHGGLTSGTAPRACASPFCGPLSCASTALRATMTELITSPSGWCTASTSNPPRLMSSGSTMGYRKPRAPCALRTTRDAPSTMCAPRWAITLAFSSAAMPTSAARKTTSYAPSSCVRSATSAVWNFMRAPTPSSLAPNSFLARSFAAPHRS
ncbi:hypothetical protein VPH35_116439 [Triticum aestivum]